MSVDFFFLNKGKYKYIHSNMIFYKKNAFSPLF